MKYKWPVRRILTAQLWDDFILDAFVYYQSCEFQHENNLVYRW